MPETAKLLESLLQQTIADMRTLTARTTEIERLYLTVTVLVTQLQSSRDHERTKLERISAIIWGDKEPEKGLIGRMAVLEISHRHSNGGSKTDVAQQSPTTTAKHWAVITGLIGLINLLIGGLIEIVKSLIAR